MLLNMMMIYMNSKRSTQYERADAYDHSADGDDDVLSQDEHDQRSESDGQLFTRRK